MTSKVTVPKVQASKVATGADPLVMVTAYDAPSARVADAAGVDMILVGDSVAMVVLGYDDTLQVTIDDMAHHVRAVARANPSSLIIGDMPWMSFHVSVEDTVRNAATLIRAGAQCVKVEGGRKRIKMIEAIRAAEIPVVGHVGLTPQSANVMGGFKIQARDAHDVRRTIAAAKGLQAAGCFAIVVEGVPDIAGQMITDALDIPVIGIGAGANTDGQVLVYQDVIGLENRFKPRFVRRYGTAFEDQVTSLTNYANDVRSGAFPGPDETYKTSDNLAEALGLYGSQPT